MFTIQELHYGHREPHVALDVQGIEALPDVLKRLAELGYNLEPSLEALQKAVDDQRKRNVLDAAINAIAEKPAEK
jgi:hypothetical protein